MGVKSESLSSASPEGAVIGRGGCVDRGRQSAPRLHLSLQNQRLALCILYAHLQTHLACSAATAARVFPLAFQRPARPQPTFFHFCASWSRVVVRPLPLRAWRVSSGRASSTRGLRGMSGCCPTATIHRRNLLVMSSPSPTSTSMDSCPFLLVSSGAAVLLQD